MVPVNQARPCCPQHWQAPGSESLAGSCLLHLPSATLSLSPPPVPPYNLHSCHSSVQNMPNFLSLNTEALTSRPGSSPPSPGRCPRRTSGRPALHGACSNLTRLCCSPGLPLTLTNHSVLQASASSSALWEGSTAQGNSED